MKKLGFLILSTLCLMAFSSLAAFRGEAEYYHPNSPNSGRDMTRDIPGLSPDSEDYHPDSGRDMVGDIPEINPNQNFEKIPDVAQYNEADWSQAVGIARGISLREAFQIAENHPEVTFFFYTKDLQMVLGDTKGSYRRFRHGDTVFFSGEPWWGSANGLADGYIKQQQQK